MHCAKLDGIMYSIDGIAEKMTHIYVIYVLCHLTNLYGMLQSSLNTLFSSS